MAIIGAGPAGLAMACLAGIAGLRVALIEKEPEEALAAPRPDGRDIALTHRSVQYLAGMGVWPGIPCEEVAPIRAARVRTGASADLLALDTNGTGHEWLGVLVANHVIRAGLYRRAKDSDRIALLAATGVTGLEFGSGGVTVSLSRGAPISASLAIAADSRFSETRRMAGIGADMKDFGRVCIVCRMRHEKDHDGTAYEWFDDDQTLAVLPLNDRQSSIVLTLAASEAPRAMGSPADHFARDVERRFRRQWGEMQLVGERHAYPLVAVYAHRFHAHRFALVGDAAVGMHPVTAHGFNFGLTGAATLANEMRKALLTGMDIGSEPVLAAYGLEHRRTTYPLYTATNALVSLYTDNGILARFAREALLRLGNGLPLLKGYLTHKLTDADAPEALA